MNNQKGFTLIELLVVIAIIAILAAILFPVFATAREKARQTSCASNEKQFGIAFLQYEQDYDEMLPVPNATGGFTWCSGLQIGAGWGYIIYPYVKSLNVFTCPSDPTQPAAGGWGVDSYAYNALIPAGTVPAGGCAAGQAFGIGGAASRLVAPGLTVLLCEIINNGRNQLLTNPNDLNTTGSDGWNVVSPTYGANTPNGIAATGWLAGESSGMTTPWGYSMVQYGRHNNGANYLACDGHVKYLLGSQVSGGSPMQSTNSAGAASGGNNGATKPAGTGNMTMNGAPVTLTFSPL